MKTILLDRANIKERAKLLVEGNMWNFWKPVMISFGISIGFVLILSVLNISDESLLGQILNFVFSMLLTPLTIGITRYNLNIVRGKKNDIKNIFEPYKDYKFVLMVIGLGFLIEVITTIGTLLLIVPGIIAAIALSMCYYLVADKKTKGIKNTLKKSYDMMNGHKMDYFILEFSFLGWILVCLVTFGLALIYVLPYMTATYTLFYEDLKELTTKK